jgi:hypothetical protein
MLVSEFASNVINNRPLKYGTRQSYFKIIKLLGIWDLDISELNCARIFDKVDQMRSHNVKKNVYICLRSVFRDLGIFKDLQYLEEFRKPMNYPFSKSFMTLLIAQNTLTHFIYAYMQG